jgi:HK97 family phage major capsid protein
MRSVVASGRMSAAHLALSRRLLLQAEEAEAAILAEVRAAVAAVVEAGMIAGSGSSNQPLGLINTPGTGSQAFAASIPSYVELVNMIEIAGDADADLGRCSWIMHPSNLADLLKVQIDPDGGEVAVTYSEGRHRVAGFPILPTRHMPEGKVAFGDFSRCTIAYWSEPQITIDRFSNGKSLSGAADVVIHNLVDLLVSHPAQIVIGSA